MANIKLDLAGFKHDKSDDKSTTLRHEKLGHTVTLYHNVLSPANQEVLKSLAKSGPVKQDFGKVIQKAEGGKIPAPAAPSQAEQDRQKTAKDLGSASRGETNTQASKASDYISNPSSIMSTIANSWAKGGKVRKYAEGTGPIEADKSDDEGKAMKAAEAYKVAANDSDKRPTYKDAITAILDHAIGPDHARPDNQPMGQLGEEPTPASTSRDSNPPDPNFNSVSGQYNAPQASPAQDSGQPPQASQAAVPAPASNNMPAPVSQTPQTMRTMAPQSPQGKPNQIPIESVAQQDYNDLQPALRQQYLAEDQAFQHDLNNGHITPMTYKDLFAKKDTLGKIGSIFGIMLGGIGSGLTHTPNAALQSMDNIIKNDLESQKTSKENAHSFKTLNQQRLMNQANIQHLVAENKLTAAQAQVALKDLDLKSDTLAHMQANRVAYHDQAEKLKTLAPGTPAYNQTANALALMSTAVDNMNSNLADKAAGMSAFLGQSVGQGAEQAFKNKTQAFRMLGQKDMAEDMEQKHLSNETQSANRPIEKNDRDKLVAHDKLDGGLKDLSSSLDKLATYNHYSPNYIHMVEKIQKIQADIRDSTLGTVYREGEQPLLDKILKTPAGNFDAYQTKNQINELQKINHRDAGIIKNSYGIKDTQGETTGKSGRPIVKGADGQWRYK